MKVNARYIFASLLSAAMLLTGCNPESVSVTIPTAAVQNVANGKIEKVKVKAVFNISSVEDEEQREALKAATLRHIGSNGKVTIGESEFVATFDIPFCKNADRAKATSSVMLLVMHNDGKIELTNGGALAALNDDLSDISSSFSVDLHGGIVEFNVIGTSDPQLKFTVIGAIVDDEPIAIGEMLSKEYEITKIVFDRSDEHSIWKKLNPYIIYNK